MRILLMLPLFALCSCVTMKPVDSFIRTSPTEVLAPIPAKVILVDAYDVSKASYRDSKEALFDGIIRAVLVEMKSEIDQSTLKASAEVFPSGFSKLSRASRDSLVQVLRQETNATHVIFLNHYNVEFIQTDVVVSRSESGKSKEAFYDIRNEMTFQVYDMFGELKEHPLQTQETHSSRSVLSGLLAAGPNVVKNRDDALAVSRKTMKEFLRIYFPGKLQRTRELFMRKEFQPVGKAIERGDYAAALEACLPLTSSSKNQIAAQALYNCAILSELLDKREQVPQFLKSSLQRYELFPAMKMMQDYDPNYRGFPFSFGN